MSFVPRDGLFRPRRRVKHYWNRARDNIRVVIVRSVLREPNTQLKNAARANLFAGSRIRQYPRVHDKPAYVATFYMYIGIRINILFSAIPAVRY